MKNLKNEIAKNIKLLAMTVRAIALCNKQKINVSALFAAKNRTFKKLCKLQDTLKAEQQTNKQTNNVFYLDTDLINVSEIETIEIKAVA